jgi:hypothetical protein
MNGKYILKCKSEQGNWHQTVSQITQCGRVPARECGFPGARESTANNFA